MSNWSHDYWTDRAEQEIKLVIVTIKPVTYKVPQLNSGWYRPKVSRKRRLLRKQSS